MVFSLFIIRKIEESKPTIASFLAHLSFYWMGFLILFVTFSVALLLLFGVVYKPFFDKQINFTIASLISLTFIGVGYINAQKLQIRTITIQSKKIQKNMRLVFFSDLHAGLMINKNYVDKISKTINDLNPDLVIAGGDMIDSSIDGMENYIKPLKNINPIYGKYAILGNHEFYRGIDKCQTHLENVGFRVLRNDCVKVNEFLNIAGIDDTTITSVKDREILSKCNKNDFKIFVKHRPLIDDYSIFDLALCGHTHAGQMFPFTLLTKAYYHNRDFGYFNINGSHLIISSGAGTWGPPFRIFSSSEIVLINLEKLN
jgi:predicted MPP superfamily phosphohydrolase